MKAQAIKQTKTPAVQPKLKLVTANPVVPFVSHVKRPIQSVFYGRDKKMIRTNHAAHANSAVMRSVDHMQLDRYQAAVVEIFDATTGVLHAVIRWHGQTLQIVYKRDPKLTLSIEEQQA